MPQRHHNKGPIQKTAPLLLILGILFALSLPHRIHLYAEEKSSQTVANNIPQLTSSEQGIDVNWTATLPTKPDNQTSLFEIWLKRLSHQSEFELTDFPGKPQLPSASFLIALPATAEPQLVITRQQAVNIPLPTELQYAPFPSPPGIDANGNPSGGRMTRVPLPTEQMIETVEALQFEEIGRMRGVRLARLTFSPITIESKEGGMALITDLQATLIFNVAPATAEPQPRHQTDDPLLTALHTTVINPNQIEPSVTQPKMAAQNGLSAAELYLDIDQPGLHQITYEALVSSSANLSEKSPHRYELQRDGTPIPLYWDGDGDDSFEAGERFIFYAPEWLSRWSTQAHYGLVYQSQSEVVDRMQARTPNDALPAGDIKVVSRFEEDNYYTPNCFCGQLPAGRDGERWVWEELRLPGNPSFTHTLRIEDIDPSKTIQLDVWTIGFTSLTLDPDHQVIISADGRELATILWDGKTANHASFTLPAGTLSGNETLQFALEPIGIIDGVWIDAFELSYTSNRTDLPEDHQLKAQIDVGGRSVNLGVPTALSGPVWGMDVTDPYRPVILSTGPAVAGQITLSTPETTTETTRFALAADSQLLSPVLIRPATSLPSQEGDYIIIGPAAFETTLAPLITLRTAQGLQPTFVSFESIVDQYGFGERRPEAIRDFLTDAYATWQAPPSMVLLVGDGTYDPKQNQPNSKATVLPVYFANVDPWAGEVPADNRFVTVDGDDLLPDMAIGRLPVNDMAELETIVAKLVAYPDQNKSWRQTWTFVSDNADLAGNFAHSADEMIELLEGESSPYRGQRHTYAGDEALLDTLRTAVETAWNSGSGHMIYNGHSTVHQWGDESFFHFSQINDLANLNRPPIVLQMTCFTGSYQMPGLDSLDEALLRRPQGGAIAVWGATGLGVSTGHESLSQGYIRHILENETTTIGAATLAGKLDLFTHQSVHNDLMDTFTLLGDPALLITLPGEGSDDIFLPLIQR